jgi:hypothetical protein
MLTVNTAPMLTLGAAQHQGGGTHAEMIAGILERMAAEDEAIDWWDRGRPRRRQ